MPESQLKEHIAYLTRSDFILEREQDITSNVLLSCDEIARTRGQAFGSQADPGVMSEFLAMPGSDFYNQMRAGAVKYKIFRLKKK
jgi:hypothetical protein